LRNSKEGKKLEVKKGYSAPVLEVIIIEMK